MALSNQLYPLHQTLLSVMSCLPKLMVKTEEAWVESSEIAVETLSLSDYFLVYSQKSHLSPFNPSQMLKFLLWFQFNPGTPLPN